MLDRLLKGRLDRYRIAVAYTSVTHTVTEAVRRHDCDPPAAHLLGRAIAGAVLTAASLEEGERLNARWAYEGLLRVIVVDTGPDGKTRAFISPPHLSAAADENELYGESGTIQLIRMYGGSIISQGIARADLLDVVEDLNHFLCTSDQIESAMVATIALTSDPERPVRACRGVLLQAMPGCDLYRLQRLRDRLFNQEARQLLTGLEEPPDLPERLFEAVCRGESEPPETVLKPGAPPEFRCSCGPDKMDAVLKALPPADREEILKKNEPVTVACRFCGERYRVTPEQCRQIWNSETTPPH